MSGTVKTMNKTYGISIYNIMKLCVITLQFFTGI